MVMNGGLLFLLHLPHCQDLYSYRKCPIEIVLPLCTVYGIILIEKRKATKHSAVIFHTLYIGKRQIFSLVLWIGLGESEKRK